MSLKSLKNQTLRNKSTINSVNLTGGASTGPVITSIIVTDSNYNNLDDTALLPAGGYAKLIGSGFASGCSAYFNGSSVTTTFVSATEVRVVIPATTAGTYNVMLFNPSTAGAIYLNLGISSAPTFTTTAGSLGTSYETTAVSTSIAATGDAPITYALYSGSLPTGVTLASNGTLSGTSPVEASSTTYSFVVQATDAQLQDTTRSFSLTISTDIVTWSTPAADFAYTLAGNEAMSNVSLSAASAAGYNITYAANTLPTGVSLSGNTIFGTPTVEQTVYTALTATAETTGRSATRYVSWSIALGDAFFEYNTLLLPGASTTFVDDASTNNFAVTIAGDTKPNSFNPYTPGYYSNYFDGNGDYLTTPTSANLVLPNNQNWTVESWVYLVGYNTGGNQILFLGNGSGGWTTTFNCDFGINSSTGYTYLEYANGGVNGTAIAGSTVVPLNRWIHLAWVYNGTAKTVTSYVNGIVDINAGSMSTYSPPAATVYATIGRTDPVVTTPTLYFWGYMSNTRIVKGTAVYTSAFTPPTSPLTAISGTSLLTCQSNRFIDNSTNNFTITVAGNTTVNSFDPFVPNSSYSTYGSGYFDGTGDYLSVADNVALQFGTGNFTIEMWVYLNTLTGVHGFLSKGLNSVGWSIVQSGTTLYFEYAGTNITSSTPLVANKWTHIAVVRSGTGTNQTVIYVDGVSAGTGTVTTNFNDTNALLIGEYRQSGFTINAYVTDVRIVKGTAVYTTTFTPPSAPLTAISGTSLLTLQNNQPVNNNVFLDNSTNNFLVTRNGNATQGTFSPYGGNWSNYFGGQMVSTLSPSSTKFNLTGDFTLEAYVFLTALPGGDWGILDARTAGASPTSWLFGFNGSGKMQYYDGTARVGATTITLNTWHHVSWVRNGSVLRAYLNGVLDYYNGSYGTSAISPGSTAPVIGTKDYGIGAAWGTTGYISNLRVVNGTAVYTTSSTTVGTTIFTPSTTPLTPIANTTLLTCADSRFIDDSLNNYTITPSSSTISAQRFSPFNPSSVTPTSYSGYFDGSGDYLSVANNTALTLAAGDFTIECWFYITGNSASNPSSERSGQLITKIQNSSNYYSLYVLGNSTTTGNALRFEYAVGGTTVTIQYTATISQGQWYHVAVVRNGSSSNNVAMYLNGNSVATGTITTTDNNTGPVYVAYYGYPSYDNYFYGYISNARIVKGTAVYTGNFTPSTTPLTAISGTQLLTCQSPTFIDNSTNNFTITAFGNSKPTIQNPFGFTSATTNGYTPSTIGGSVYFDGTGDSLSIPAGTYLQFTGNYTIEFWIYFTSVAGVQDLVANYVSNAAPDWTILIAPTFQYYPSSAASYVNGPTPVANRWYHVAAVRSGTTCSMYIDGVSVGTPLTFSGTLGDATRPAYIGSRGGSIDFTNGYMSDVRITKSAVYNSNFVPPSAPLLAVQNTVSLLNMTSAGIYDAAMMTNMETVADAKLSTAISKFGGSSMSFDGTGDWLTLPITPQTSLGPTFTIEAWIYLANTTGTKSIYSHSAAISGAYGYFIFYISGTNLGFYVRPSTSAAETGLVAGTLSATTWTHVAVSVNNTACRLFINGTQVGSTTTVSTTTYTPVYSTVGADIGQGYPMNGYIDDLRITRGYARYTSNFTPPTSALQIK